MQDQNWTIGSKLEDNNMQEHIPGRRGAAVELAVAGKNSDPREKLPLLGWAEPSPGKRAPERIAGGWEKEWWQRH